MNLTKNKKILRYFYKKYFLKIKNRIMNSKQKLLDDYFNQEFTSYTNKLNEPDFFFYSSEVLEKNLEFVWGDKKNKEFNQLIKIIKNLDEKLVKEEVKQEISKSIYVMY